MNNSIYGVLAVLGGFILVIGLIGIVLMIIRTLGLYTIAKRRGIPNPWLLWIPVAGNYTFGQIADNINESRGKKTYYKWILLGINVLTFFWGNASISNMTRYARYYNNPYAAAAGAAGTSAFGSLLSLAAYVVLVIVLYNIYSDYRPSSATTFTVLTAIPITNFLHYIFVFLIRNDTPAYVNQSGGAMPAGGAYQPPQGWNQSEPMQEKDPWDNNK